MKHFLVLGPADEPVAPRPQAGKRPEQKRFSIAGIADDEYALAGFYLDMAFLEHGAAGWRGDLEIFDVKLALLAFRKVDAAFHRMQHVRLQDGAAEACDAQKRRTPSGKC